MTPVADRNLYLDIALQAAPRLFSLLDRTPFSPSAGSWHRAYWHERRSDFSSSACQQGMLATALLHQADSPRNPYYQQPPLREWVQSSVRHLLRLQHDDGSFDEWYPNERGWAGPTGYVIYALAATCRLMGLDGELAAGARRCAERACRFLGRYEELDVLANHQAMALLALAASRAWLGIDDDGAYERLFARLLASYSQEGWALEYDGADPGYQTATASFLARVHRLTGDPRIQELAQRELEFLQFFFLGERSFGGVIGSRSTKNLFHFGLEYWASRLPLARTLAAQGRILLAGHSALWPGDQDDHYLTYRMPELLEAFGEAPETLERGPLPCDRGDFRHHFAEAGLLCWKQSGQYLVINLKKGGALRLLLSDGSVREDAGWVVQLQNGRLFTSSAVDPQAQISVGDEVTTRATAAALELPLFTTPTLMAFRALMAVAGRTPRSAQWLKGQIRRRLMTRAQRAPGIRFVRRLRHDGGRFLVEDELTVREGLRVARAWMGGAFMARMVPQSKYFLLDELGSRCLPLTDGEVAELNRSGKLRLLRELS